MLERFHSNDPESETIIGTHLFPVRLFSVNHIDRDMAIEVIKNFNIHGEKIMVTRMSGLFVKPPKKLMGKDDFDENKLSKVMAYEERIADCFNMLICEMTLQDDG